MTSLYCHDTINNDNILALFYFLSLTGPNFEIIYFMTRKILLFSARMGVRSHVLIHVKYHVERGYIKWHVLHMTLQHDVK